MKLKKSIQVVNEKRGENIKLRCKLTLLFALFTVAIVVDDALQYPLHAEFFFAISSCFETSSSLPNAACRSVKLEKAR